VSDIAAMGGRPGRLLVAVAGPPDTDVDGLYRGVAAAAAVYGCPVVGGDLANADQLVVAVTVTGTVADDPGPVTRRGARPGDVLVVTGPLGGAAAGLRRLRAGAVAGDRGVVDRHRRPQARVAEGEAARRAGAHAMIDVSDGLTADVGHLASASGVGVELDEVPVDVGATADEALTGGDDYELVVATADPEGLAAAFAAVGLAPPTPIGRCVDDPAVRTLAGRPLPAGGWEHRWRT